MAKKLTIPAGFRPVKWADVQPGTLVYLRATHQGKPVAAGPHIAADPENHTLYNMAKVQTFTVGDDTLLYKEGPLAVCCILNGRFNGIYADVPLELIKIEMQDDTELKIDAKRHRPRPLDKVPSQFQKLLQRDFKDLWEVISGTWMVLRTKDDTTGAEGRFEMHIRTRLAAAALASEMLRHQKHVDVEPTGPETFIFHMTRAELDWVTQHLHGLTEGVSSVTA